ncbi:site-specific recombinase, phage integrase family [Leptospira broomii serovar Hurstbridge str. 5399]|uniref:Site-specific recombinase, phage integrase family n=1 Tax=Leptospira broomii serovar Hurstbridge str. 5399 TaxID=1049789 RepID=T0FFA0_9LEPT|nr:tyrosine-type recombinase/integrase [Leptospira broomii]EQA46546.1 site-specific recombinase, phage integrase family [Leptospira broomii serovar Hurstbridge str. 5399]
MLDTEIPKKNKASFEKLVKLIRQRNYKKATEYTYLRYNLDFLLFANKPAEKVVTKDIEKYIEHLKKRKVSSSTIQINISSLKMFFEEVLNMDVFDDFRRPAREYKTPKALTVKEVSALLEASALSPRSHLLVGLAYYEGLRVGEIVRLKWGQFDLNKKSLYVDSPVPTQKRTVILDNDLLKILKRFEKEVGAEKGSHLFPGKFQGKPLTSRNVERLIGDLAKEAGIKTIVTLFTLRHSRAVHQLAEGKTLEEIRDFLGHKSLATTESYLPIRKNLRPQVRQKHIQDALKEIRKKYSK